MRRPSPTSEDPLDFTPVPSRSNRRDGWTPERQRSFIEQLARLGLVGAAARAVGMSRKSAYALRARAGAEGFAQAWDDALEIGHYEAIGTAIDRAVNGVEAPVFHRGLQVGTDRRYDDKLLIAALRATGAFEAIAERSAAFAERNAGDRAFRYPRTRR